VTEGIKTEVDRILQNCVNRCVARKKDGKPCHAVSILWIRTSLQSTDQLEEHEWRKGDTWRGFPKQWGWQGRGGFWGWFGFNPKRVNVYSHDTSTCPTLGQAGDWSFNLNAEWLLDPGKRPWCPRRDPATGLMIPTTDDLVAATVAHELFLHVIGGVTLNPARVGGAIWTGRFDAFTHFYTEGYVDAATGKVWGGVSLQKPAANSVMS